RHSGHFWRTLEMSKMTHMRHGTPHCWTINLAKTPIVPIPRAPRRAARASGFVQIGKEFALPRSDAETPARAFWSLCKAGRESFVRGLHDAPQDQNGDSPGSASPRRKCVKRQ